MIVLADDFTGAAEIAAASFGRGYASAVLREPYPSGASSRHLVLDTDSRLASSQRAEEAIRRASAIIIGRGDPTVFKKVDSVLRGNVASELSTLATELGRKRILLLPANPSSGRTIKNREYLIDGTPLDQTEFAKDPTHPASSSDPVQILGPVPNFQVHYRSHADKLPESGIILCEASTPSDVQEWAKRLLPDDLPSGGRDFFESILARYPQVAASQEKSLAPSPTACLLVQGTVSPQRESFHQSLGLLDYLRLQQSPLGNAQSVLKNNADSIRSRLSIRGLATLEFERHASVAPEQAAREIEKSLAEIFANLQLTPSPLTEALHLVIEGGATAALILKTLELRQLRVTHVWAGGVVSLSSPKYDQLIVTTKPGSYPWPQPLLESFAPSQPI